MDPTGTETPFEWTPPMLLQVALIGAMLVDKKLRDRVDAGEFTHCKRLAGAVAELKTSKGRRAYPNLRDVLQELGVEWNDGKEDPLERMLQRLKLDSEVSRVLSYLGAAAATTLGDGSASDAAKGRFLRTMASLNRDLKIDLSVTNDRK